jgi:hypothetical protein
MGESEVRLISDPGYEGCPHSCLLRTSIANYAEGAALLGLTVNPQEHSPYTPIRCFAPCVICNREEPGEEELRVLRLFDQLPDSVAAGGGQPEREGGPTEARYRSPGGGSGKATGRDQRRASDKGKAKVQDSWAAAFLKKGKAPKRKREREEEVVWRRRLQEDRNKEEEELRLLAQLERFIPEEGGKRRERVRRIRENAEADPEVRAELVGISRLLVEWEAQQ